MTNLYRELQAKHISFSKQENYTNERLCTLSWLLEGKTIRKDHRKEAPRTPSTVTKQIGNEEKKVQIELRKENAIKIISHATIPRIHVYCIGRYCVLL